MKSKILWCFLALFSSILVCDASLMRNGLSRRFSSDNTIGRMLKPDVGYARDVCDGLSLSFNNTDLCDIEFYCSNIIDTSISKSRAKLMTNNIRYYYSYNPSTENYRKWKNGSNYISKGDVILDKNIMYEIGSASSTTKNKIDLSVKGFYYPDSSVETYNLYKNGRYSYFQFFYDIKLSNIMLKNADGSDLIIRDEIWFFYDNNDDLRFRYIKGKCYDRNYRAISESERKKIVFSKYKELHFGSPTYYLRDELLVINRQ